MVNAVIMRVFVFEEILGGVCPTRLVGLALRLGNRWVGLCGRMVSFSH